MVGNSL